MYLKEAEYVMAIERHRTIYRAARELGITQPSLSRFLQGLERELGVKLFQRSGKRLVLTYAGEQYTQLARQMLQLNQRLEDTVTDIAQKGGGRISVGVTPARGRYVLPNVLPALREKYPGCHIQVLEAGTRQLEQALRDGEVDLLVYTVSGPYSQEFRYEYISTEEVVLCVGRDTPYPGRGVWRRGYRFPWVDLRQMEHELFVLVSSSMRTGQVAARMLEEAGIRPEMMTVTYVETAISMAAQGMGVCFCTDMCSRFFEAKCPPVYLSTGVHPANWDFVVATRREGPATGAAAEFVKITKEVFGNSSDPSGGFPG